MILYFADRKMNILGNASTSLPKGLSVVYDNTTEDIDSGVASLEFEIAFDNDTVEAAEKYCNVGNYILKKNEDENEFYTIIDFEKNTEKQIIYVYAEDAGLDLLNEIVGSYEADKAYPIEHYINEFSYDSGFEIGINEADDLERKLSWDGETTAAERIRSVATQFDNCEISYSFDIEDLAITHKYINIYRKRGKDEGIQLRLNKEIGRIITNKSIKNLATALEVVGGTPESEGEEEQEPITLKGYEYDDGDIYISGTRLYSRTALEKWSRYIWANEPNQIDNVGHIVRTYSYDTTSQKELCSRSITELKKLREIEVNYEVEILVMPENVKIGDTVNIIDDKGNLYLSTRLLKLERSITDSEYTATLGEFLIKEDGISQTVMDLAAQFAETAAANRKALEAAKAAQEAAKKAEEDAASAKETVETLEETVENQETSIADAQAAAEAAKQAAAAAETKVTESHELAVKAQEDAANAQTTANEAKDSATNAATTAAAAKLDAEQAQKDIDALGDNLTTLESTMKADYARKTDLTEATASLQTQITQNAAEISSTATKVQTIDETANSAKETAENANSKAQAAQIAANSATSEAQAAQKAADEAQANLDTAQAELNAVKGRVDATEEEIAAAQEKVNEAQSAANNAAQAAANAQTAANEAQTAADKAQEEADALKVRMTTAETSITQNAEAIQLRATKTEVEAIEIGGRNLLYGNGLIQCHTNNPDLYPITCVETEEDGIIFYRIKRTDSSLYPNTLSIFNSITKDMFNYKEMVGQQVTLSLKARASRDINATFMNYAYSGSVQTQFGKANETITTEWNTYYVTIDDFPEIEDGGGVRWLPYMFSLTDDEFDTFFLDLRDWKFEKGSKATDWTPAPEDMAKEKDTSYLLGQTNASLDSALERISKAESIIEQLSSSISMLVTDGNSESLMTQTSEGWTFNIQSLQDTLDAASNSLNDLTNELGSVNSTVDALKTAVNDLGATAEYIKIEIYEDEPSILFGESDSDFKLRITNTRIMFVGGSNAPTYVDTNGIVTKDIKVENQIKQGGFRWKLHGEGNLGFVWEGGSD